MALTNEDLQAIGEIMDKKLAAELAPIKAQLSELAQTVQTVHLSQVRVENEWKQKLGAALDRGALEHDKNKVQDERITYLEKKTDFHDARIYGLEQKLEKAE